MENPLVQSWFSNPDMMNFVNINDLKSLGLDPTISANTNEPETTAQKVKSETLDEPWRKADGGTPQAGSGGFVRDATDNFGYVSKPNWTDYASLVPGVPGMVAKGVNAGWNLNNAQATEGARSMLGLDNKDRSIGGFLGDARKDKDGQVAEVAINDNRYSVGFEALSPAGNTNLTPNEARSRGLTLGGLTELPAREKEDKSFFGSIIDSTESFLNDLFGGPEEKITPAQDWASANREGTGFANLPDTAPTPTSRPTNPAPTGGGASGNDGDGTPPGYDAVGTPENNDSPYGGPR